jgi:anti-sigma factor RsiW
MRCEDTQNRLVEYIEGELRPEERAQVEEHLDTCPVCKVELEAFQRTMAILENDGYEEPSPFYWTRFEAGLRAKLGKRRSRFGIPSLVNAGPRLVPIAVAVLFFCVGLGVGLQPVLRVASTSPAPAIGTETVDYSGPVVSPRAKSLVESGLPREEPQYAVNAADTLTPESFDSAVEQPRMILATEESWPVTDPGLGEWPARD